MFSEERDTMIQSISLFNNGLNQEESDYHSDFSAASNKYNAAHKDINLNEEDDCVSPRWLL